MHAIKGGWVGQTFALAKCNGSERKKSRTRCSKKDRKAMVQSFIKKYQSSNSGSFPSLHLTHKEVGGFFYTVRGKAADLFFIYSNIAFKYKIRLIEAATFIIGFL